MSSRGFPIRRLFPYTPWGLTFLTVGTGVLALGAARVELAALIWGSAAVLLAAYALAGVHLSRGLLRRHLDRSIEAVDFRVPSGRLFPGDRAPSRAKKKALIDLVLSLVCPSK